MIININTIMISGALPAALCLWTHHAHDDIQRSSTPAHAILLSYIVTIVTGLEFKFSFRLLGHCLVVRTKRLIRHCLFSNFFDEKFGEDYGKKTEQGGAANVSIGQLRIEETHSKRYCYCGFVNSKLQTTNIQQNAPKLRIQHTTDTFLKGLPSWDSSQYIWRLSYPIAERKC